MPLNQRPQTLSRLLDTLPEAVVLTLLAVIPAFVNLATARIFEEEKALLLRAGAVLLLASAGWHWRRHASLLRHPLILLYVLFMLVLAIASVTAVAPFDAFFGAHFRRHGLLTWLALSAVFAVACDIARTTGGRQRLLAALILGSLWPALYALAQTAGFDPLPWDNTIPGRSGSTVGNPLFLAGYLVVVIPVTTMYAWRSRAFFFALALQLAALAATGSRGPILALGLGAAIGGTLIVRPRISWQVWAPSIAVAVGLTAVIVASPNLRPPLVNSWLETGSGRVRVLIWDGVRQLFSESGSRFWIGYGPDSLQRVFPRYYVPEIGQIEGTEAMPDRAHNEFMDTLVSAGAIGALCQLMFFIAVVTSASRISHPQMRAGVLSAAVVHLSEIQLGIATVSSRLAFMTVVALIVGTRAVPPASRDPAPARPPVPWWPLVGVASFGALSPVISRLAERGLAVDAGALAPYTDSVWLPSIVLYLTIAAGMFVVARSLILRDGPPLRGRARSLVLLATIPAIFYLSIAPSAADSFSRAGTNFERASDWPKAALAYEQAVRVQPRRDVYQTALARSLVQGSLPLEPVLRDSGMDRARALLEGVRSRNPRDPFAPRNLASLHRIHARTADEPSRVRSLATADEMYMRAVALAPDLPALWSEWANVKLERGLFNEAAETLQQALALDDTRFEPWLLLGHARFLQQRAAEAIAAYNEALEREPENANALSARSAAIASVLDSDTPSDNAATLSQP